MMNITICLVSQSVENFYLEAIEEYAKRLSKYCKIQLLRCKREEHLAKKLMDKYYKILISNTEQSLSSLELASKIEALGLSGISDIAFLVGTQALQTDESLALSPLDMDPGLQTTLLFEQIYRAYRILKHQPYHK